MSKTAFDWDAFVPHMVHPTKVAIVEALRHVGHQLSPVEMTRLFDDPELNLSKVAYHARALAEKGALARVTDRQVRGALERFYYFPDRANDGYLPGIGANARAHAL